MHKSPFLLTLYTLFAVSISTAQSDFIFDVDFENPPHLVDQQVLTGAGTDRPQFADTTVIVRDSPADFTTQAASLEPAGAMVFAPSMSLTTGIASVSWDMAMISLARILHEGVSSRF